MGQKSKLHFIEIDGNKYPVMATTGAYLRYKDLTGEDVSQMKNDDIAAMVKFLYCCTEAGCARSKHPFSLELMEFADAIDINDIVGIAAALAESPSESQKKTKEKAPKA